MADLQDLLRTIDELPPDEFRELAEYIDQRRRATWWVVPAENVARIDELMRPIQEEAAQMSEEEVNALIDEAIAEVRRERKTDQSSH